jgi:class 3 adenylate cyclase/tetratricopeptide (TPR) repeat protein
VQRCASCGEENSDKARFCSACGASLDAAASSEGEERKVVSVLFVDLVGFTARSDEADPEDVRATLRVYHDLLKREIERFGGTVEKFIGDAVMAVFGAPIAHEDDAERAVRSALRIVEAIDELNEERPALDLAIRAAVNTGEAVVSLGAKPEQGEGFVTGDVVNVASRLQGIAPTGGVVVGELTHRATRGPIEYEELAPVEVKGKDAPLPVWHAIGARSRFGVDVEAGTATPLIGRDRELSLLQELYRRSASDRNVQLVTLSGEPGVGKSRLAREFRRFIDDEPDLVYWRQGRCLPYGEGITFWALGEIVKAHAGILESDTPEDAVAKLETAVDLAVEDESERDWIRTRLAPLVGIGGADTAGAEREESFAAWCGFIEGIAAASAFVMVIEDLHWADPAMLEFVEHLADWASDVPLVILCTARPELYERQPGWGGGKRNHTAVSLSPLSPEETARLIGALLDQAVLPSETQTALMSRAGGNPLYAEEFVRMLIDREVLVRRGAAWKLDSGEEGIPVPESVHSLIAARLDTLPPERKSLLQDAAVLGKVFWAGAVAEMGGREASEVREGLHELARKELVRSARRPSIEGETEFAFWHLLIRDVAYGQIPRAARAAKHRAAAAWIERMAGDRVEDSAELLVYHYEQAIELGRATGEDVAELEALAVRFLMLGSERAMRLDIGKSFDFYRRALELTRPGERMRLQVALLGARFTIGGGRAEDHEAICRDALAEAQAQGDELAEGEILSLLSRVLWGRGETAKQYELIEEAVRILKRQPPGHELAEAMTRAAAAYGLAGRSAESLPRIEAALPVVREFGSDTDLAVLLQFRGQARVDFGEVAEGIEDVREGLRVAIDSAPAGRVCAAHVNLGDVVWFDEGPAKGQELYEEAIEIGLRRGATYGALWAQMQSMWTRFDLGRWDELLEIGDRVIEGEPDRTGQIAVMAQTYRQSVLIRRGVTDGAAILEGEILPRAREIGDGQVVVPAFRTAAVARLFRGEIDGAIALVEELGRLMGDLPGFRGWMLDDSALVCLGAGRADVLSELLVGYTPYLTRDRNSVHGARAVLAEAEGDHSAAARLYEEAADRWRSFPAVLEHARALTGVARCLLEIGRASEASDRLRGSREVFSRLGAAPLVAEVDELLGRATALSS